MIARAAACCLLVLAWGRPAHAGPAEEARAGKLFDQAEGEYQAGRFKEAVALLQEAQRLAPDPVLDYNIARAYEGLGEIDLARKAYRAYLDAAPDTKDRGAVEARLRTLDQQAAERDAAAAAAASSSDGGGPKPPAPPPEKDGPSPVPWVIAGVGALGLGAAGVLGGLSLAKSNEAEDPATSGSDAQRLSDEASPLALGANVTFGVAGALGLAGVIWGIVDVAGSGGGSSSTAWQLDVGPTGALFRVRL